MSSPSRSYGALLRPFLLALMALVLPIWHTAVSARQGNLAYVWIESEAFTSCNVAKPTIGDWGRPTWLSGQKWIHLSIDADKLNTVPDDAALLTYKFNAPKAADYEVWNRLGFEFVRSTLQWRIDNSDWQTITPQQLTTDLVELQDWSEVAWIDMGKAHLTAGPHTLEIRLPKGKDEKGQPARILYASDALCLCAAPLTFRPNGKFKPDEEYRTPADLDAAKKIFTLPTPKTTEQTPHSARVQILLAGTWEICRHDEQLPGEVAAPIKELPSAPHWSAITVPGDKNTLRPDLLMAHRVWYRTRIEVPASYVQSGRSFQIVFPQNNLNTTVYLNDNYCGFNKNPYARFAIDITKAIKPGINELKVGIRDAYYGYSANPKDPMKLRRTFNIPLSFTHMGFQQLAYPIWNAFASGILATPELVVGGPVYASDVFCRPSVSKKELAVDVTLANPGSTEMSGEVVCAAVDPKTGQVEKTLAAHGFKVPAHGEQTVTVADRWENPRLWWPSKSPAMYHLRTTVRLNNRDVDISETPFGFREWGTKGSDYTLNGVVWHLWADLQPGSTPEEFLANYRKTNQHIMRYMGSAQGGVNWLGLSPQQALDFFDRNGVVVRRCGPLDGEAIGYMAIETDPVLKDLYKSEVKMDLMRNWRDQMVAQVRGERNHPSIMLWSLENEWLYINCINLYGGLMDAFEAEVKKCSDAVREADPTRLTMTDGGGANRDQSMPVHGNHYVYNSDTPGKYPALAYEVNATGGGRGRWVWDQKRPRFIGEDYFATGINPFDYAYFGGEETFGGKAQAHRAMGLVYKMLTEGYRWSGQGAWHHWVGPEDMAGNPYNSQSPRAVLVRQWDSAFLSGQRVRRTVGIFNDTHDPDPITFTWTLTVGGKKVASRTSTHRIAPGGNEKFDITLPMPVVTARQEGTWNLTLTEEGKTVFTDTKPIAVLKPQSGVSAKGGLNAATLYVYDPQGAAIAYLKSANIGYTPLSSLKNLPAPARVLLIGKDALDATEATSSRLAAYANEKPGHIVIVLEQKNPLKYTALPVEMEPAQNEGRTAYAEAPDHPIFANLKQSDLFTWGDDEVVYRNAYLKPTRGGKSLIQCDVRLQNSVLAEIPAGNGLILVSQLLIGEKLSTNATAQQLFINLLAYGATYKLAYREVSALVKSDPLFAKTLDRINLNYKSVTDVVQTIATPGDRIAVVEATPANLKALAENSAKVNAFTQAGGWIFLHGLTPEGLNDYNRLVGFDHMIRPFWRERVAFPPQKHPLTAGLTTGDIVMRSGKRMFNYNSDEWVADDIFTYCVDYDDVAPFAKYANDFHHNMANGMVSADGWPYIIDLPFKDATFPLSLPKPQQITRLLWIGNKMYNPASKIALTFDGNKPLDIPVKPNDQPQEFPLNGLTPAKEISLRITEVERIKDTEITGLDNISLYAKRPADFYQRVKPLVNVGAMMAYPRGRGGILLCNVRIQENEAVPENADKKRTIVATLLRNLRAPFAGGKSIIAGAKLAYQPVDIGKFANQYRDDRGWFGDKAFTFKDLPVGRQTFGNVPYQIYDFQTSPVPTAIMLDGPGVPNRLASEVKGIGVNKKADALFFLHTARVDQPLNDQERREKRRYELFKYLVHYADGQRVEVPVYQDIDVANYRQAVPAALPGAQLAWVRKYDNSEERAVAYSMQWNNPRPNLEISSIDLVYGKDRRAIPALLAITAAVAP